MAIIKAKKISSALEILKEKRKKKLLLSLKICSDASHCKKTAS
jgi:hypothetical protein